MHSLVKQLREATDYPWQDCLEAARMTTDIRVAVELLPGIWRKRNGVEYRGECTRTVKPGYEWIWE
ncbi:hypothetical protein SEA_RYADEL_42 [Mycobacterium phage Ryadel]|uniref:Uncharacterized protein n=1 Tax=Mycobacterium phage Ryadel TaxID=2283292 RepID=A0A345MFA4_9CAUD|nr:hypothetical protein KNU03_gp042 [Mycobacterium phage Ryadel]AXH69235.1 hypothetical protein SEA_RYADEL_42 [Mycobacterium phage Ryadel]